MVPVHFQTDHCQLATCTPSSLYALSQQKRLLNMTGYNHSMHHVLNKFAISYYSRFCDRLKEMDHTKCSVTFSPFAMDSNDIARVCSHPLPNIGSVSQHVPENHITHQLPHTVDLQSERERDFKNSMT